MSEVDGVVAPGLRLVDIGEVHLRSQLVGIGSIIVTADALIDVGRHVHQVSRARHQLAKPVG